MVSTLGRIDVEYFLTMIFEMWKLKMEDLLTNSDLWHAIGPNFWKLMNYSQALMYDVMNKVENGLIKYSLTYSIIIKVHKGPTAKYL